MDSAAHFEINQPINKWPAYGPSNHHPEPTNQSAYILNNLRSLHAMMPTDCKCVDRITAFKSLWHTKGTRCYNRSNTQMFEHFAENTSRKKLGARWGRGSGFVVIKLGCRKLRREVCIAANFTGSPALLLQPWHTATAIKHLQTLSAASTHIKYKYFHNHIHINTVQREKTSTFGCFTIVQ